MLRVLQFAGSDETLNFIIPLAKVLKGDGFEVLAAARKSDIGPDMDSHGIPYFDLPITRNISPISIIRAVLSTAKFLRVHSIDIIHCHTFAGGVIGRLSGWLAGTEFIIYMGHGWLYTDRTPAWKRRLIIWTERLFRRITNCFFLISREEEQTGIRDRILLRDADSVLTFGIGIDCDAFDPDRYSSDARRELREKLGIPHDAWVACFVGRIVVEKGLLELGRAFADVHGEFPETRLVIAGTITESERDRSCQRKLTSQLNSDGSGDAVLFMGRVPDVRGILSISDAFILPTYREGMPVALMEAMAMGLPCIATDVAGCREEIVDGESGFLVEPRRAGPLKHCMRALLTDPASASSMGRAARARVLELFSLEKVIAIQLEGYRRIRRKLAGFGNSSRSAAPNER